MIQKLCKWPRIFRATKENFARHGLISNLDKPGGFWVILDYPNGVICYSETFEGIPSRYIQGKVQAAYALEMSGINPELMGRMH